jgi:ABC-type branched-subunit amino acid transport system ATPase component/branched-subunit amino acid ABC-type transport system permease component
MTDFLPFIVIGLAVGAVYGLAGVGIVLTYKTSGILNFGYGAVAALSAFFFYLLHVQQGLGWPLAAVICVLVFAPVLGLVLELMARSLQGASEMMRVVATVGLILVAEAIGVLWHPQNAPIFPTFLPQETVHLAGVNITWQQIITFLFSLAASAGLYWFFRATRPGAVMRSVVDNPELVSLSGYDPVRVRRWSWIIGTAFSAIAGVLLASTQPLDGVAMATIVFSAFGSAAIGYFSNLPLTFAGGLAIGIAGALASKYAATISWAGGLAPSVPFLVLFVVLIVIPRRRMVRSRISAAVHVTRPYHAPARIRFLAGAIAIVLLAFIPAWQSTQLAVWTAALIDIILFLSLGLLVKQSGLISLCQLAFAAVGAAAFGHFAGDGIPWLFALVLAVLVAIPIGAVIAIPAVRVSGVFLALATLGFAIGVQQLFYSTSLMFGDSSIGIAEPRPDFSIGGWDLSSDQGFYYLALIIAVLAVAFVTLISNGRLGRLLEALSDSPLALETHGVSSNVLKVLVFCIAAALAALAGALTGMLYQFGVGSDFQWFNSVYIVAVVVIMAIGDPWYAVIGALAYAVLPGYIQGSTTNTILQLLFGLGAATVVYGTRNRMPLFLQRHLDRLGGRADPGTVKSGTGPGLSSPREDELSALARRPAVPAAESGLVVTDLVVRFGGVTAVNNVSLHAPAGMITGLVGPNGAGKTTTFNACSGLNRPDSGRILLHGADVSREGPALRARRGLGRTFQRTELFDGLTVRQNVAMGREAPLAGGNPVTQVIGSRHSSRLVSAATGQALELAGITHLADAQVGVLPIGQRRLVELARALAGPFDMLLLDEPSSGLDARETREFGQILTTVVRERRCGILLVEHDMGLVRDVCGYVFVLDFGTLIFEGTPAEMRRSDLVRAAYLGDAEPVATAVGDLGGEVMAADLRRDSELS